MKNILFLSLSMLFVSCSSNTSNASRADTMNGLENTQTEDTTVAPFPNGYAPPNTPVDSSQKTKDSVDSVNH